MPDILSQSEIDELLSALASGAAEPEKTNTTADTSKIKVYDFKTADKFPKEQVRTLNIIYQTYAQLLANQLMGLLQTSCDVDLLSVEELSFSEFTNSLPAPVVLAIVDMPPLQNAIMMQLSPEVVYAIVSRLFGGSSGKVEKGKAFTEIEQAVIERVLRQTMKLFDEAWTKVIKVNASLNRIETSSQFAQIVGINEPVAIITLNVKINNEQGIINICLPRVAIESVAKQLNTRSWYSGTQAKAITAETDKISQKVVNAEVTMRAVFNPTPATVQDIINLQLGDVIRLNHRANMPITVNIQHMPKFRATLGRKGSQYAVKIIEVIKGENSNE